MEQENKEVKMLLKVLIVIALSILVVDSKEFWYKDQQNTGKVKNGKSPIDSLFWKDNE